MLRSRFLAAVLILAGASLLISAEATQKAPAKTAAAPAALLQDRVDAAQQVFEQDLQRLKAGVLADDGQLSRWSERWLEAELALKTNPAARIAALEAHLQRAKEVEKIATQYAQTGQGQVSAAQAARYFRTEAELRMLQERAR